MADPTDDLRDRARREPRAVQAACLELLESGVRSLERAEVLEALGWTQYEIGALPSALSSALEALAIARAERSTASVVRIAQLIGTIYIVQGQAPTAEKLVSELVGESSGAERIVLRSLLAIVLGETGRDRDALAEYRKALDSAHRRSDPLLVGRLLNNRAVLHLDNGRFSEAEQDLDRAEVASTDADNELLRLTTQHNRGVLAARSGRLPSAIKLFGESARGFRDSNAAHTLPPCLIDTAALLLDAGLIEEAQRAASEAVGLYAEAGSTVRKVEGLQLVARLHAASGNWSDAAEVSQRAVSFAEEAGISQSNLARYQSLANSFRVIEALDGRVDGQPIPVDFDVTTLRDAPEVAVDAAMVLIESSMSDKARALLETAAEPPAITSAVAQLHHAVAVATLAQLDDDGAGAVRLVGNALRSAAANVIALGATELRSTASRRIRQLRNIAVGEYLKHPDMLEEFGAVLELERSVRLLPEPQLTDRERALVTRLRRLSASTTEQRLNPKARALLAQRCASIEQDLVLLRREQSSKSSAPAERRPPPHADSPPIVSLLSAQGNVLVIVRIEGQLQYVATLPASRLNSHLQSLRLLLSAGSAIDVRHSIKQHVDALQTLLQPLLNIMDDFDLVCVIGDAEIEYIPWSLLTKASVMLCDSEQLANRPRTQARPGGAAVSGPGLQFADVEVNEIGETYSASFAAMSQAKSNEVIDLFSEAGTLHLAAHGTFRFDNPLFSSIELSDGPLTFLDLLTPGKLPDRIIFSACAIGRRATHSPVGLVSLLTARGLQAVVASVGPVDDQSTRGLMVDLHARLSEGELVGQALAGAQRARLETDPSVALFASFGVG